MLRILPVALAVFVAVVARREWRRVNADLDRRRESGSRDGTLREDETGQWRPSR